MFKLTSRGIVNQTQSLGDGLEKGHETYSRQRVGLRQRQGEVEIWTLRCGHH